ncbi:WXG100 family type VII secretion target [Agrococcus sp. KRD186]|jgi:WXG100 family type VII secretion target|uniref:WXG100 family type VII secretion target n=1 Tax=Agrococcus sp. KRD186 TaxID=2729730 RepID=UPI0019D26B50|nr:WXG100 family type VII secretion target [Agrococcus sp. KRD186]
MVYFKVRADSLSEVAALIGGVIATFDSNLSSVNSTVNSVANATWQGEDATKFSENWTSFVAMAGQVRTSLAALQTGLIAADGSYTQTETGIRSGFTGRQDSVIAIRGNSGSLGARVARGEDRAEDMAEFFGRDYAGDGEVEEFGGGMLGRRATGQYTGGGSGDTDGDGDDDSIGTGVFLSAESRAALAGDAGAATTGADGATIGDARADAEEYGLEQVGGEWVPIASDDVATPAIQIVDQGQGVAHG